jgi:hypothetical protein
MSAQWKWVPVVPTPEMVDAACNAPAYEIACDEHAARFPSLPRMAPAGDVFRVMWRLALDAAPAAPELTRDKIVELAFVAVKGRKNARLLGCGVADLEAFARAVLAAARGKHEQG